MLESLVISLLNRFLGDFIDNVKAEQLNIALWSGNVVLENVALKRGALDALKLPIDVRFGFLGKLTLKIPWKNLKNEPLYVDIDRIYAIAGPKFARKYDATEDEKDAQELKKAMLERLETIKAQRLENKSELSAEKEADFFTKLALKIVDNLQVNIGAIHVRYEDALSNPAHPIAVGVTLNRVSALSCNAQWQEGIVRGQAAQIFKLAKLDSLALYWESYPVLLGDLPAAELRDKLMALTIKASERMDSKHSCILLPLSAAVKLRLDTSKKPDLSSPQVWADIVVENLGVTLDDEQVKDALKVASFFVSYIKGEKYRRFHPPREVAVAQDPRAFWRFAQQAVLFDVHDRRRRWTWAFFKQRRDDRTAYVALYKSLKLKERSETKKELEELEKKLEYADIAFYRSIAEAQLKKDKTLKDAVKAEKAKKSWFGSLMGKKDSPTASPAASTEALSEEQLLKQLYETIEYDDSVPASAATFAPAYERFKFDFALKSVAVFVRNRLPATAEAPRGDVRPLLEFSALTLKAKAIVRPASFSMFTSLEQLTLTDQFTAKSLYPRIIHAGPGPAGTFMSMEVHDHPMDAPGTDLRIVLRTEPVEVTVPMEVLVHVLKSFLPPADDYLLELQAIAMENLSKLTEQTRLGLAHQLTLQKSVDLLVNVKAPVILVPQSVTSAEGAVLVVDLGRLVVSSSPVAADVKSTMSDPKTIMPLDKLRELAYDRYNLDLEALQVILAADMTQARQALTAGAGSRDHVLQKTDLKLSLDKCIIVNDVNLPLVRVSARLPEIALRFSDAKFAMVMRLVAAAMPHINAIVKAAEAPPGRGLIRATLLRTAAPDDHLIDFDAATASASASASSASVVPAATPSASSQDLLLQTQQAVVTFSIGRISLVMHQEGAGADTALVSVMMTDLKLDLTQREFDMHLTLTMKHLGMDDLMRTPAEPVLELRPDGDVIQAVELSVLQISRESPAFLSSNAFDQQITTKLGVLALTLEANAMIKLISFFKVAFKIPRDVMDALTGAGVASMSAADVAAAAAANTSVEQTVHVEAVLRGIMLVTVTEDHVTVLKGAFGQTRAVIDIKGDALQLHGDLGGLLIESSVSGQREPVQLISTAAENTLTFDVATFPKTSPEWAGHDVALELSINAIHVLFAPEAVEQLLARMMKFASLHAELQDQLAALEAAAEKQRKKTIEAMSHTLILLDIKVQSPHIVVRRSIASRDYIEANLGEITLHNKFVSHTAMNATVDVMTLGLSKVALRSHFTAPHNAAVVFYDPFVADFGASIEVRRLVIDDTSRATVPLIEIVGSTKAFFVEVSNRQVHYMLGFADEMLVKLQSLQAAVLIAGAPAAAASPSQTVVAAASTAEPGVGAAVLAAATVLQMLDLAIVVEGVGVQVYQEDLADEQADAPGRRQLLLETAVEHIDVRVAMQSDNALKVEANVRCIAARDCRASSVSLYRCVIDSGRITVCFTQDAVAAQVIDVSALGITTTLVPELFIRIADTLLVPLQDFMHAKHQAQDQAVVAATVEEAASASQPSQDVLQASSATLAAAPAAAAAAAVPAASLVVTVQLLDARVRLVGDSSAADSAGVVLHTGTLQLKLLGADDIRIEVDNTAIHTGTLAVTPGVPLPAGVMAVTEDALSEFRMLEPFGAEIRIVNSTNITLTARPLHLRVSYQDLALFMGIVNVLMPLVDASEALHPERRFKALLPEQAERPEDRVLAVIKLKEAAASDDRSSVTTADDTASISSSVLTDRASAPTPLKAERLAITLAGLQLEVINDYGSVNVPLLSLQMHPTEMTMHNWSSKLVLYAPIKIQGDFFNNKYSSWETIIEPWAMELTVRNDPESGAEVVLSSETRMEVSVTADLISAATDVGDKWAQGLAKAVPTAGSGLRKDYQPYRLVNDTGLDVTITSANATGDAAQALPLKIAYGQSVTFALEDWRMMHRGIVATAHSIGVSFAGDAFKPLNDVAVDRIATVEYTLEPVAAGEPAQRVVLEVSFADGRHQLELRSAARLHNRTGNALAVTVGAKVPEVVLGPGESKSVPILACLDAQFSVRDTRTGYAPSKAVPWSPLLQHGAETLESYHSASKTGEHYRLVARLDASAVAFKGKASAWPVNAYPSYTVDLVTPWKLENLLPTAMDVVVTDAAGTVLEKVAVASGTTFAFHKAAYDGTQSIAVSLPEMDYVMGAPARLANLADSASGDGLVALKLTHKSVAGNDLLLKLSWTSHDDGAGKGFAYKHVAVSAPYVIVNKSGSHLIFKQSARLGLLAGNQTALPVNATAVRTEGAEEVQLVLFSYPKFELFTRQEVMLRTSDSDWSQSYSLEATGSAAEVPLTHNKDLAQYQFGMQISVGQGKRAATKVIHFTPRYMLVNNTDTEIQVLLKDAVAPAVGGDKRAFGRLLGSISRGTTASASTVAEAMPAEVRVPAKQRVPLHFSESTPTERMMRIRTGQDGHWSVPFKAEGLDVVHVKLDASTVRHHVYRVEKIVQGATIFLQVYLHKDPAPYRIDNKGVLEISFLQYKGQARYTVAPGTGMPFVWDDPLERRREVVLLIDGEQRTVDLLLIGDHKPWKVYRGEGDDRRKYRVFITVFPEAATIVVKLHSKLARPKQAKGVKLLLASATAALMRSETSTADAPAAEDADVDDGGANIFDNSKPMVTVNVHLAGFGVSVVSRRPQELLYVSLHDVHVEFVDADVDQTLQLNVGRLQIDNQLPQPDFPVILRPIIMRNRKNAEGKEAETRVLTFSFRRLKYQSVGVLTFQYLSLLLQELSVEVSESFIMVLVDFVVDVVPKQASTTDDAKDFGDLLPGLPMPPVMPPVDSDKIYFEMFEIQPIKVDITFVRSRERGTASATEVIKSDLFRIVVDVLSNAIANIENAPLNFNALAVRHLMTSAVLLGDVIGKHYGYQVAYQVHRLVGSVDLIGNPIGLFSSISSGVEDFFYEPYQGLTRGPKDFALGVGTGSVSLVRNLGYGVLDTTSKLTGSVGKGVAQITMDEKYLTERDASRIANRHQTAAAGSVSGAQTVLQGFTSGVTGIFTKPIEGAREGGFTGFLAGTAKGVVGAVAKPVVGIFDGASQVAVGLRNSAKSSSDPTVDRVRTPRHIGPDHILRPYNPRLAHGAQLLHTLTTAGNYADQTYVTHVDLPGTNKAFMLTNRSVMLVSRAKNKVSWAIPFSELADIRVNKESVVFVTREGGSSSGGAVKAQQIDCPDAQAQQALVSLTRSQVDAFARDLAGYVRPTQ